MRGWLSEPVSRAWVSPAGNTPKFWLHFSNAHAAASMVGGGLLRRARYDGVYTDCSCEDPPGIDRATSCSPSRRPVRISVDQVLLRAAATGKWVSSWSHDGEVGAEAELHRRRA